MTGEPKKVIHADMFKKGYKEVEGGYQYEEMVEEGKTIVKVRTEQVQAVHNGPNFQQP